MRNGNGSGLPYYWRKAMALGLRTSARKAAQKTRAAIRRRWLRTLYQVSGTTASPAWRINMALRPESRIFLTKDLGVRFPFWKASESETLIALLEKEFPAHTRSIKESAQEILLGNYTLLTEKPVNLRELAKGTYLPWHSDWAADKVWDSRVPHTSGSWEEGDGFDVKRPWELSRLQHLVTLAQAYFLTGQRECAQEVITQINAWNRENPPGLGINWSVSMEVGIRITNILFALGLLQMRPDSSLEGWEELRRILPGMVFDHAIHILRNPEWPNNHLLADLASLNAIASLYPHFQASQFWGDTARRELTAQMEYQVYPDGMDFEASTHYHGLVLEFFFISHLLWKLDGVEVPDAYESRLKNMFQALTVFQKPSGHAAQFGDNDSGRFLNLDPRRDVLDHRALVCQGAAFFGEFDWLNGVTHEPMGAPEAYWLIGPSIAWKAQAHSLEPRAVLLPQGKIASFRNPELSHFIAITNSRNGQHGKGGHAHNDKLSFELVCHGETIFTDPGSGCYLEDIRLRNRLRSTFSHNTLGINGLEQNGLEGAFVLSEEVKNPQIEVNVYDSRHQAFLFRGSHDGYSRLRSGLRHQRLIEWKTQKPVSISIIDTVNWDGKPEGGPLSLCWNFILHPSILLQGCKGGMVVMRTPLGKIYVLESSMPLESVEMLYSPRYGVTEAAAGICAKVTLEKPKSFEFRFTEQVS